MEFSATKNSFHIGQHILAAVRALQFKAAAVLQPEEDVWVPVAGYGFDANTMRTLCFPIDAAVAQHAWHTNAILFHRDLVEALHSTSLSDPDRSVIANSAIEVWVPVVRAGTLVGLLAVGRYNTGHSVTTDEADVLTAVADLAAIAIGNEELVDRIVHLERQLDKEQRTARALDGLYTASTQLWQTHLELDARLDQVLWSAVEAFPTAELGAFWVADESESELRIRHTKFEYPPDYIRALVMALSKGYAVMPAADYKSLVIANIHESLGERRGGLLSNLRGISSAMVTPLIEDDVFFGVLSLYGAGDESFSANDLELLERFAVTASSALRDVKQYANAYRLALIDPLTGIYNRRGLFTLGQREIERAYRTGTTLAAIMMDLDSLKQINDTYGHSIGDRVLIRIADSCRHVLRSIDIVGRYGSDEFTVLLPEADLQAGQQVAERLRQAVSKLEIRTTDDESLTPTVSLGVAVLQSSDDQLATLVDRADRALYQAKRGGRNRVRVQQEYVCADE